MALQPKLDILIKMQDPNLSMTFNDTLSATHGPDIKILFRKWFFLRGPSVEDGALPMRYYSGNEIEPLQNSYNLTFTKAFTYNVQSSSTVQLHPTNVAGFPN